MEAVEAIALPALSSILPFGILVVLGCWHWSGALMAAAVWWVHLAWTGRRFVIPSGGLGALAVAVALILSTILSQRPSGLAWAGLLQWLSLLTGIIFLQAELRKNIRSIEWVLWGLLIMGCIQMAFWTREVWTGHAEWWMVRTEGLPRFPFRIRLFGSHGSTQCAAWLACLLLVGSLWAYPRTRRYWRPLVLSWLAWCSVLIGFCDSRLAMAGAFAGVFYAGVRGHEVRLAWTLFVIPNVIWWARDHLHPSRIIEGGGVDQGWVQFAFVVALPGMVWIGRRVRWAESGRHWAIATISAGIAVLALPAVYGVGERIWATGRLDFWRVGLDAFVSSPIWGCGPWSFPWVYSQHVDWSRSFLAMHPHNWVLELLVSGGALLVGGVAWLFAPSFRRDAPGDAASVIPVLGVALAISMIFDSPLASPQVMLVTILVGGWAVARQAKWKDLVVRRAWFLLPLALIVPVAHLADGLAGKAGLAIEHSFRSIDDRVRYILDLVPSPPSDPQWLREQLWARTARGEQQPDSLAILLPLWDSLITLEPMYTPNRLNREYCAYRLGRPNRLIPLLDSFTGVGWKRGYRSSSSSGWSRAYPTDSSTYWLGRALQWRAGGDSVRLRWVAMWFREAAQPATCAEVQWKQVMNLPIHGFVSSRSTQTMMYGAEGSGAMLVPGLEIMAANLCFRNFRN